MPPGAEVGKYREYGEGAGVRWFVLGDKHLN